MAINSQIPQDQWQDFFVTFSNGNRAIKCRYTDDFPRRDTGIYQQLQFPMEPLPRNDVWIHRVRTGSQQDARLVYAPDELQNLRPDCLRTVEV